jgi:hypothetical protein
MELRAMGRVESSAVPERCEREKEDLPGVLPRVIITIMRLVRYCCGFSLLITFASVSFGWRWYLDSKRWVIGLFCSNSEIARPDEVEQRVAAQLYCDREATKARRLQTDEQLHGWLGAKLDAGGAGAIEEVLQQAQMAQPHYLKIAAYAARSTSVDGLLEQIEGWEEQTDSSFTHQAIVARARPARMGYECVILAGQRLEDFVPEAMRPGHDLFFSKCPLCGKGQPCNIPHRHRSVSLECPHCHRTFAMIAPDTKGRFHYMSDYLTGYAPPAHFPAGISRYDEMVLIWRNVIGTIRYVPDSPDGSDEIDVWQFALETEMLGTGDCEDSAILLADWLGARGFEVRVALGRFAELGGHAWVVVRLGGKTYLLEATSPHADTVTPPLSEDVGSRYVPETVLDRDGFNVRRQPDDPWDGDYFTPAKWIHIKTPRSAAGEAVQSVAAVRK